MITTTLNRILEHSLRQDSWEKLLDGLGKTAADDEPLPFAKILEINGLMDAIWCCCTEPQYDKEWRLLAVKYARRVEHLNTDPRVKNAIDVAERYANGEATDKELALARAAAEDAADDAAGAAVWAVWAAEAAAEAAARTAAKAAAKAARDAAEAAERDWQTQEFLRVVTETEARET
jgi:hypothetical protein